MTTIGRYRIESELGTGSMGSVFRAHDPTLDRTVAIKTIRLDSRHFEEAHDELVERFHHEARSAGRLSHPNIVTVYDYGEHEGSYYLVMEHVSGRTLAQRVAQDGALDPHEAAELVRQTCAALQAAHAAGVVHRDIKPSNLIFDPDTGLVKVMDFGIAKLEVGDFTRTGTVMGTPSYMSPEQLMGKPVDGRSDLFSLGAVYYELLTGRKAFAAENIASITYKIVHDEPGDLGEIPDTIGPGAAGVLRRALAKSPDDRFASAQEFGEAIASQVLGSAGPVSATEASDTQPVGAATSPSEHTEPVTTAGGTGSPTPGGGAAGASPVFSASRRNRTRGMAGWLTAGALVVALALFAFLQFGPRGTPPWEETDGPLQEPAGQTVDGAPSADGAASGDGAAVPAVPTDEATGADDPVAVVADTAAPRDTLPPPPPEWRLGLTVEPASASITIDDSVSATSGDSITLVEGAHAVRIAADGFFPVDTVVDLVADGGLDIALRRSTGTLKVTATVAGRVSLDGRDRGAAPYTGSGLRPGAYSVRFVPSIGEVLAEERRVDIAAGRTTNVGFEVTDGLIRVAIREPRWATVYVGDTRLGDTPLIDYRHRAGLITLRLVREGYRTAERQVRLEPGARIEWVDVRLEAEN